MNVENRGNMLALAKRFWIGLVLCGLTYYLWFNGDQLLATLHAIPIFNLLAALVCILIGKLAALYLMRASLILQSSSLMKWRDLLWVYTSSDVAKYMPGGIWAIVGRLIHYRNYSMSAATISKALLLEKIGFAITALALGLPVFVVIFAEQGWVEPLSFAFACALLLSGIFIAAKLIKKLGLFGASKKSFSVSFLALLVMTAGWVVMGTSFYLLLPEYNDMSQWLWFVASYATAFLAGMIAVFAPAGVGVREGVLVMVGQFGNMQPSMMLDAALLNRAIWVVADVCFFLLTLASRISGK